MIRYNTDCPYCHDIFDQYCNLFKSYKNCDKNDCKVLKILKENEQLKEHCDELELINQKMMEENEQLICNNTDLKQSLDWANEREVEWANRVEELKTDLEYAKAIIKDLLNNSHEYSRQNAEDFIKEKKRNNKSRI